MIRIFPVTKKNILYWKLSIPQPELSKYREKIEEKSQYVPRLDSGFFHTLEELTLVFSENVSLVRIMGLNTDVIGSSGLFYGEIRHLNNSL